MSAFRVRKIDVYRDPFAEQTGRATFTSLTTGTDQYIMTVFTRHVPPLKKSYISPKKEKKRETIW